MTIQKGKVVSFEYTLKDSGGTILDSSEGKEPLVYLHGAENIIPGLESALDGKSVGEQVSAIVAPEDGYGARDEALVGQVPREHLVDIEGLEIGMQLEAETPEGPRFVYVVAMDDTNVTIDANHPLAGMTLHFDLTVAELRDATEDELKHGHAHGPGGHHHD